MKVLWLMVCVMLAVVTLSYTPSDAGVYRSKAKASCSGVARSRVYSRGKSCSGGVSKVRVKHSCAGSL